MEQYVTYHKIIKLLELFQQSQENIGLNSFGHGNLVDFGMTQSGMTPVYPFMFVSPQSVSQDENITTYTLQILFGDRINFDMSNEIDVISNMSIQAKRFISYIKRGFNQNPDLYSRMDCNLPITAIPFLERFDDYVGGIAVDIEIIVFEDINACDYYELNPSPTPSVTPTNTVTPTPTQTPGLSPSPTPTNTSTPTVTPSITPTNTTTPTSTVTPTPTDPRECRTYTITADGFGSSIFNWTNCDGTSSATTLSFGASTNICAKQGSVTESGFGTITDIGTCPLPSPTPTPTNTTTPTLTPSVTPTNTATPTVTPTNTTTPTKTPTNTPTPSVTPFACRTYNIKCATYPNPCANSGGGPVIGYYPCASPGLFTTMGINVTQLNTGNYTMCARNKPGPPTRFGGEALIITDVGPC
jgi:hypothetical protein